MKIATITTALLGFAPTMAQAVALRSKGAIEKEQTNAKAQIIINGVLHDFSDQDLAIISDSAISAYNAVQKDSGYSLKEVKPSLHFGVGSEWPCMFCPPDDDSFSIGTEKVLMVDMNVGVGSNWPCMFCPPDDDTVVVGDSASHKVFTETFCERLSFSGSPNLANAHHCSFTFLEQPGHKAAPVEAIRHKDKTSQAFLSITGLPKKLTNKDLAIIDASAIEAYKDAYEGHSLKSISARGIIDMPKKSVASKQCINCPSGDEKLAWPCMFCPPDDDSFELTADEGKIILLDVEVGAQWPCMFCPPDDDSFELGSPDLKYVNTAFSKALCSKLRNSGSANLAKADDCAMEFFYEPSTSK